MRSQNEGRCIDHLPRVVRDAEIGLEAEFTGERGQKLADVRSVAGEQSSSHESLRR